MKKLMLLFFSVAFGSSLFAQNFASDNTGVALGFRGNASENCPYNFTSVPMLYWSGDNITSSDVAQGSTPEGMVLISHPNKALNNDGGAIWGIQKPVAFSCEYMWSLIPTGIDMSSAPNRAAKLLLKADAPATIAFIVGSSAAGAWPSMGVSDPISLTTSWQLIPVDLSSVSTSVLSNANCFGFKTDQFNGKIYVKNIALGSKKDYVFVDDDLSDRFNSTKNISAYLGKDGIINIKGLPEEKCEYKIFDLSGSEIHKGQLISNGDITELKSENLTSGIYILSLINEKGQTSHVKLVIAN